MEDRSWSVPTRIVFCGARQESEKGKGHSQLRMEGKNCAEQACIFKLFLLKKILLSAPIFSHFSPFLPFSCPPLSLFPNWYLKNHTKIKNKNHCYWECSKNMSQSLRGSDLCNQGVPFLVVAPEKVLCFGGYQEIKSTQGLFVS